MTQIQRFPDTILITTFWCFCPFCLFESVTLVTKSVLPFLLFCCFLVVWKYIFITFFAANHSHFFFAVLHIFGRKPFCDPLLCIQVGTLRFCGSTEFSGGLWAGVELDKAEGKNNGAVAGVQYFTCRMKHGKSDDAALGQCWIHQSFADFFSINLFVLE